MRAIANTLLDHFDKLFEGPNPHAFTEAQRLQERDPESDEDGDSESEDQLTKELLAGFEDADDEDEQFKPQHSKLYNSLPVTATSLAPVVSSVSAPPPTLTAKNVAEATERENENNDDNDSDQEFEDVPLYTPKTAPHAIPPLQIPVQPRRGGRQKKQPPTHNLNGLPIRRDAKGVEIGYKEVPPAEHTYAWVTDTTLPQDDPYFLKGCLRRMVFESDPVPVDQQYKAQDPRFEKKTNSIEYLSAVDKAYDWNCTRRGVTGATEETLADGKLPRHFVLKMGAPNGPNGDALRVAERLKAIVKHYFYNRLAKSYLTIEIEIPYITLAGMSYFEKYIEKIREVMEDKTMRDRLTVQLASESSQRYLNCDPESFYPPDIDHEAKWQNKIMDTQYIWALLQRGNKMSMSDSWNPKPWDIENAKQIFLKSSRTTEVEQKGHIEQAIEEIKDFIRFVRNYEAWKRDDSKPQAPPASVVAPSSVPQPSPKPSSPTSPVIPGQQNALELLRGIQSHCAAASPSASSPTSAPAPSFLPIPQPSTTSIQTFDQTPLPAPKSLEVFKQPEPQAMRYAGRGDQFSVVMSFGSTSEQQARNITQMLQHQTRQYHRDMQQEQMRQYQQQRAQQRGPPAATTAATATSHAPLSSPGLAAGLLATSGAARTASTIGKRKVEDELEDEGVDKRWRQ